LKVTGKVATAWIDETERITLTLAAGDGPEDVVVCVFSLAAMQRLHESLPGDNITLIGTNDDVAASGPLFGRAPGLSSCGLAD
jgi:hypothetical protein